MEEILSHYISDEDFVKSFEKATTSRNHDRAVRDLVSQALSAFSNQNWDELHETARRLRWVQMWNFALEAFTVVTRGKLKIFGKTNQTFKSTVSLADALRVTACNMEQDNCRRRRNDVLSLFREALNGTQDESLLQEARMRLGSFYTDKGEYDAARSELQHAEAYKNTSRTQLFELRMTWIDIPINQEQFLEAEEAFENLLGDLSKSDVDRLIRNTALDRYANVLVNIKWKAAGKAEDSTLEGPDLRKAHDMYHELFNFYSGMSDIVGVSGIANSSLPYLSIRVVHYGNQMRVMKKRMEELKTK
ncbi:hypothetical protein BDP55DRAFT_638662 [Colletotrichum godetiae]|uniref:Uncharacterized protein n=1 Tax=Colletotrichum godetiae TaxID=1209918 RepID=A0AAJ0EQH8_9PEZI|nr:uncharacterized protein BDP55DRAFT_638662 [Colletotrichum godetiae]KAK1657483.1 hypothetical protein BDP55DRAFT_638662 [Colletotrichum godetiae]